MTDTIGCYNADCICNEKTPEPCEMCDHGYIYDDKWFCDCCGGQPCGEILIDPTDKLTATGLCRGCRDHTQFERDRTTCKCQG